MVNVEGTREEFKRPFDVNMIYLSLLGGIIQCIQCIQCIIYTPFTFIDVKYVSPST